MRSAAQRRRQGLLGLLLMGLPWSWRAAQAQKMNSGQLLTFEAMVQPWVKGARLLEQDVTLNAPILAENGSLVPLQVQVNSPMTAQDHVTQVHLLSQRNPVTQMAVFELGPWNGRADISTRVRLAGTQEVVALARLSSGEFRYARMEIIVTESACVDAS
jgi:sulfur-oxidizing protein SoxY